MILYGSVPVKVAASSACCEGNVTSQMMYPYIRILLMTAAGGSSRSENAVASYVEAPLQSLVTCRLVLSPFPVGSASNMRP